MSNLPRDPVSVPRDKFEWTLFYLRQLRDTCCMTPREQEMVHRAIDALLACDQGPEPEFAHLAADQYEQIYDAAWHQLLDDVQQDHKFTEAILREEYLDKMTVGELLGYISDDDRVVLTTLGFNPYRRPVGGIPTGADVPEDFDPEEDDGDGQEEPDVQPQ